VGTPVLTARRLTAVLSLERHTAHCHSAVLINAHRGIFLFINRFDGRLARFKICEALRLGHYLAGRIDKDVIISPDFLQCRNVAPQQSCAILLDRLSDLLLTLAVG